MRPDIVNLRQFYSSRLGRKVKARLRLLVLQHWPEPLSGTVVGLGYAAPVLRALERHATDPLHVVACMPAGQGAIYWPIHGENRSILTDELRLPFGTNTVPHIVLLHVLEHTPKPDELLRVLWQVMAPGGKLILIVPNRQGIWSRFAATPFSTGTPYTLTAIKTLLQDADFTLRDVSAALFAPPSAHPLWLKSWTVLEWLGGLLFPRSGGVFLIEAEKQIYAAVGERVTRKAQAWQGVAVTS